jgi:hypothetical protein
MKTLIFVLISIVPGFLASLVFIVGASPFEVQGRNTMQQEALGGCAAVFLFSMACQFGLTRMGGGGFVTGLLVMAGMLGAHLTTCAQLVSGGISHNWPMLLSGCIGSFVGMSLSIRRTRLIPRRPLKSEP